MAAPREICARCGREAEGFATINNERYCHGDKKPSCYEEEQRRGRSVGDMITEMKLKFSRGRE